MAQSDATATIVIPAHNEVLGLRRLLPLLIDPASPGEFRIIVVCNGCTDASADEARANGDAVEVVELSVASKAAAIAAGADLTTTFPLLFIDADVAIDAASVRALRETLSHGGILAAAPSRVLERAGVSRIAGWYYDVWERLPQVRSGLFGRGVIALAEKGHERVTNLPRYISDDLAFSESFAPEERSIVDEATVSVWPARTWRSLLKRRMRVIEGNRELSKAGRVADSSSTHVDDLLRIVRAEPLMFGPVVVFVATTLVARLGERRRRSRQTVWLRDETSRSG